MPFPASSPVGSSPSAAAAAVVSPVVARRLLPPIGISSSALEVVPEGEAAVGGERLFRTTTGRLARRRVETGALVGEVINAKYKQGEANPHEDSVGDEKVPEPLGCRLCGGLLREPLATGCCVREMCCTGCLEHRCMEGARLACPFCGSHVGVDDFVEDKGLGEQVCKIRDQLYIAVARLKEGAIDWNVVLRDAGIVHAQEASTSILAEEVEKEECW